MPRLNLPWTTYGRPIKPVSLILMNTMFVFSWTAITDKGALLDSLWGDFIGVLALLVAAAFIWGWFKSSQKIAEYCLLAASAIWGFRFWALLFVNRDSVFTTEALYMSLLWSLLAGGSWLLERADPNAITKKLGDVWTRP